MRTRGSRRRGAGSPVVWVALCIFAAGVVATLLVRQRTAETLRGRIEAARMEIEARAKMVRAGDDGGGGVGEIAELERLRGDHAALERLRAEVDGLKKSVAETRPLAARKPKASERRPLDIGKEIVPASAWRNVGYATPAAAIETALWAAAGGDTDVLMRSCVLEAGARRRAEAMLASFPKEMQARYASPEELVAFMTAKDVPLDGARILAPEDQRDGQGQTGGRRAAVQLRNAAGLVRQVHIALRETPEGWRLVVPESAVERYAEQLKGAKERIAH